MLNASTHGANISNMEILGRNIDSSFKIIVRTGKRETKVTSFDEAQNMFYVDVKGKPIENEANIDILKYFKKLLKNPVRIKAGLTSKSKLIEIL